MAKNLDELDLSGVDEVLAEDLDLSGIDEALKNPSTSELDLSGIDETLKTPSLKFPETMTPMREPESMKEELVGTGAGAVTGFLAGKAVATPLEKKALDAIAANMGFGKQISKELGDVEKRRLAKQALDLDIFKILGDAEQQREDISSKLKALGQQQSALYKEVSPETKQISLQNLLEEFKKRAAPSLSVDRSEMQAYRQAIKDLENLSSPISPEKKMQTLGLEELQELKKKYGELAYKEGKSLVGSTDKASMASKGNIIAREAIEKLISEIPQTGQSNIAKLKEINKLYSDLSKIEPGIALKAGKEAATADSILNQLKSIFVDTAVKGGLKAGAKYSSKIPAVGSVIGATLGGIGGALAAEEGQKTKGAAFGIAESFRPVETLGVSELPKTQMAKEALEAEMRQKSEEAKLSKEIRNLPMEKKIQPIEALKGKIDYTPEQIQQVSEKILSMKGGESYADVLNQAAQQPERTRKSIVFGLLQQPAFRELMKKVENE